MDPIRLCIHVVFVVMRVLLHLIGVLVHVNEDFIIS